MVKIRLARHGSKKRPYYRLVVIDARKKREGRYLERLGFYAPLVAKQPGEGLTKERCQINEERAKYWLSVGAQPTDRVRKLMKLAGIL